MSMDGTKPDRGRSFEAERVRAVVRERLLGATVGPLKIDRFTILERLGEGTSAVVYVARDPRLNRKVALKLYHGELVGRRRLRMLREAQALARINHPNVVSVYDVGEHRSDLYIAMEYVAGQTLAAWQAECEPSWEEIVDAYIQAGRGLAAIHAAGLVHRDFKPANVIRGEDGRVRVLDLGLVRGETANMVELRKVSSTADIEPLDSSLTRSGTLVGTPAYMAPEQMHGEAVSASDQFALCVSIWEAIYGQRPFVGSTITELALDLERGPPRRPPRRVKAPRGLVSVLRRGLAEQPARRWPNMQVLLSALERATRTTRRPRIVGVTGGLTLAMAGLGLGLIARTEPVDERSGDSTAPRSSGQITDVAPAREDEPIGEEGGCVAAMNAGGPLHTILAGDQWRPGFHLIVAGQFGGSEHEDLLFYDRRVRERQIWHSNGTGGWKLHSLSHERKPWAQIVSGSFGSGFETGQDLLLYSREGPTEIWNYDAVAGWRYVDSVELPPDIKTLVAGSFGAVDGVDDLLASSATTGAGYFVELGPERSVRTIPVEDLGSGAHCAALPNTTLGRDELACVRAKAGGYVLELLRVEPGLRLRSVATPLPLPGPAEVHAGALHPAGRESDLLLYNRSEPSVMVVTVEPGPKLVRRRHDPVAHWSHVVLFNFAGDAGDEVLFSGTSRPAFPESIPANDPVLGTLEPTDLDNPTREGCLADDYNYLTGVTDNLVELSSSSFRPVLQIIDPDNAGVIAESSPGNDEDTLARIRVKLDVGYNYTIRATTRDPKAEGSYELRVIPLAPDQAED